ncbi:MAG: hypothetical protein IKE58_06425 [Blautia sp.]|nr:hypothetical protein [Blautia sp.]
MRGYRDIYKNVGLFHKLMIHFCDRLVRMKIVKIEFKTDDMMGAARKKA